MTNYSITNPFEVFTDLDGNPLENGYIYIGEEGKNPIVYPIEAYWDSAFTYPINQPIRTLAGYPSRNGTPGNIFINLGDYSDYSIIIQNKRHELVYSSLAAILDSGFSRMVIVDTFDSLHDLTGFDQPVYVRGHTLTGDGGQGIFEYESGMAPGTYTDDNGITAVPTGGDGSAAWIRQFTGAINAKWFNAVGDGSTDDTIALQAALDYIGNQNGGSLYIPKGQYIITSNLEVYLGTKIYGDGMTNPGDAIGSTEIKAGTNLTAMITQEASVTDAQQPFTFEYITFHGDSDNYTVDEILSIRVRQTRVLNCVFTKATGTGIHLLPSNLTNPPSGFAWVNYIVNCLISECDTYGIYNETSDSFFSNNYFSGNTENRQKITGGNAWIGNHFDNAEVGFRMLWDENWYNFSGTAYRMADRVVGCYFDNNITGLLIDGTNDAALITECNIIVDGCRFRANNLHVDSDLVSELVIASCNFSNTSDKAATINPASPLLGLFGGIRLGVDTKALLVSACSFDKRLGNVEATVSINSPALIATNSTTVLRNLVKGDNGGTSGLQSERHSTATITTGNTSVTVTHRLFDTPTTILVTQRAGAVFTNYRVENITSTTFDIRIPSALGANQAFNWFASVTR